MIDLTNRIEIAYNFQDDWIEMFEPYMDYFKYVYVQSFSSHSKNCRDKVTHGVPTDWNEYEKHIRKLDDFGYSIAVLFQQEEYEDNHIVNAYIEELGVDAIITSSDSLATYIKIKYPHIITIASIVKTLSLEDYLTKDLSMYDDSVLDFPFSRAYSALRYLPKSLNYHLIINAIGCLYDCRYRKYHWSIGGANDNNNVIEGNCSLLFNYDKRDFSNCKNILDKYMLFYRNDLELFDKYIDTFKLQGREYTTFSLFYDLMLFISNDERCHDISYFNEAIKNNIVTSNKIKMIKFFDELKYHMEKKYVRKNDYNR